MKTLEEFKLEKSKATKYLGCEGEIDLSEYPPLNVLKMFIHEMELKDLTPDNYLSVSVSDNILYLGKYRYETDNEYQCILT